MNEQELMQKCRSGNQKAMKLLYDTHADMVFNAAYRYVLDRQDAEDIVQISFCKVFKYLGSFDSSKGSLKSWIRKLSIRCMIDYRNKKKPFMFMDSEVLKIPDDTPNPLSILTFESIKKLIYDLEDPYRTIFNMHEIEGFTHPEIAEMLGINEGSCRVYLSRAKARLRSSMAKMNKRFRV